MATTAPPDTVAAPRERLARVADKLPPTSFFAVSAVFHYLGPSLAVLLFAHVAVLGVMWLRIASAAVVFTIWRRPWRLIRHLNRRQQATLLGLSGVLAAMNTLFYLAVARLPLATVGATEFLGTIVLAAAGARTRRNATALALTVAGVATLTAIRLSAQPLGFVFAFGNCAGFMAYVVLGHRVANAQLAGKDGRASGNARPGAATTGGARAGASAVSGIDQLAAAMLIAAVLAAPAGLAAAVPAFTHPAWLAWGIGVGICSSVIPYVTDQLAMARLPRASFALMLALLPAFATLTGAVILGQIPTPRDLAGIALVVAGVAAHRPDARRQAVRETVTANPTRSRKEDDLMELRDKIALLMPQAKDELAELVSYKSVADPRQFPPGECAKAAEWVMAKFSQAGFTGLRLVTTSDGSRTVYGERPGPAGARTVLLYAHYDVQPPLNDDMWHTPPFELTERNGRWYGRGAADCKGNIVMHLLALRALGQRVPLNLKLLVEGAEEQSSEGLEDFVREAADMFSADAILVCDAGGAAVGRPATTISLRGSADIVVTVKALSSELHSGMFGGAAPDALAALIRMLATLRDRQGNTTIAGLDNTRSWPGEEYPAARFRSDAHMLEGTQLLGDGSVADMIWARPAATVVGIDCPPVAGAATAIQSRARALINLRVPPGMDPARAQDALVAQLQKAAPWGVEVGIDRTVPDRPFLAETGGFAYQALASAMRDAYGEPMAILGLGGSIPLCSVFSEIFPHAEIILMGVEEPLALIHAPNESVDPSEIANMALAEAIFLQRYATTE